MAEERIMMKNPNTGRDDRHISVAMYEPVRDAILAALEEGGTVPFSELGKQVEARTSSTLWADSSLMWYTTSVKLHLEATKMIAKSGSPQQLQITDLGRVELERNR